MPTVERFWKLLVEVVVLCRELAVLLVGLQQLTLQLIEVCRHRRLLEGIPDYTWTFI